MRVVNRILKGFGWLVAALILFGVTLVTGCFLTLWIVYMVG